jgi:hypothetical protein
VKKRTEKMRPEDDDVAVFAELVQSVKWIPNENIGEETQGKMSGPVRGRSLGHLFAS